MKRLQLQRLQKDTAMEDEAALGMRCVTLMYLQLLIVKGCLVHSVHSGVRDPTPKARPYSPDLTLPTPGFTSNPKEADRTATSSCQIDIGL